jgi:hypothetical protein
MTDTAMQIRFSSVDCPIIGSGVSLLYFKWHGHLDILATQFRRDLEIKNLHITNTGLNNSLKSTSQSAGQAGSSRIRSPTVCISISCN